MTNNSLGLLKVLLYSRPMIPKSIITIISVQQFTHRNSLSCTDSLPILRFSPRRPGQFIMLFYLPLVSIKSVYIVTDSQSVLNILFNSSFNNNGNYIISRIKSVLDEAAALNIDIEFVWVFSHMDVTGNERRTHMRDKSSRATRDASSKSILTIFPRWRKSLTIKSIEYLLNPRILRELIIFSIKKLRPWYYWLPLRRENIVTITRLRVNHYNLKHSLFRKNFDDLTCDCARCGSCITARFMATLNMCALLCWKSSISTWTISLSLQNPLPRFCRLLYSFSKASNLQF